jgi:hypothetical protein
VRIEVKTNTAAERSYLMKISERLVMARSHIGAEVMTS